jgi:hypothetical protein
MSAGRAEHRAEHGPSCSDISDAPLFLLVSLAEEAAAAVKAADDEAVAPRSAAGDICCKGGAAA